MRTHLTRARLVLPGKAIHDGDVLLEDDRILEICPEAAPRAEVVDLGGQWLLPGLVDMHCDALEKDIEPRPDVLFPLPLAMASADRRNAAAGITTVYHALSFAHGELGVRNVDLAVDIAAAVNLYRGVGLVDNRVHARYEITDSRGASRIQRLLEDGIVNLLSFMDHSPGQGQFKSLEAYRDYLVRTYGRTPGDAEQMARERMDCRPAAGERVRSLALMACQRGVRIASHDDDSPSRVREMADLDASISEFPVNLGAARAALDQGLTTVFGAPNVLRGTSQSGSIRALDAVEHGAANCLCSDYYPPALLAAVFRLPQLSSLDLAGSVRLVTRAPALAVGLHDRGEIHPGQRADLVAVEELGGFPYPTCTWSAGRLIYRVTQRAT